MDTMANDTTPNYCEIRLAMSDPRDISDVWKVAGIVTQITEDIGDELTGWNHNRYSGIHGQPPTIALRLRFDSSPDAHLSTIQAAVERAQLTGLVTADIYRLEPWEEPRFVTLAHEQSSKCVKELAGYVKNNENLMKCLTEKPTEAYVMIAVKVMEKKGLRPYVTWGLRRNFPLDADEIDDLAVKMASHITEEVVENPDSLERFLHCFFNCTESKSEVTFMGYMTSSHVFASVSDAK